MRDVLLIPADLPRFPEYGFHKPARNPYQDSNDGYDQVQRIAT